ncbi:MAG: 2-octaprenyl-6-methoxyphenyl hydroxylase [Aestuariibacter sp.]
MANTQTTQVDVLISGGGAAGYSLALALQESDISLALVEAHDTASARPSPGFDARVIALSAQSLEFYAGFPTGKDIFKHCTAIEHIHVSDKGRVGQCSLHAKELNKPQLGGVIALQDLGQILQKQLSPTCLRYQPDSISAVKQQRDFVEVTLASGKQIETKLLVIAEGANSSTATLMNCPAEQEHYHQQAIVANVKLQDSHDHWAFERFTEHGPLALLPMADNCASLVWCVSEEQVQNLSALSDKPFIAQLQQMFGSRLGRITDVSKRYCYPLVLTQRKDSTLHRAVVVANSAQALHPIAGQGFNLGLRDIQALAQVLGNTDDPGSYQTLRRFQQLRQQDRHQTITMTDALVRLFSNNNPILALSRNAGLIKMALTGDLRKHFARTAMGLRNMNNSEADSVD